MAKKLTKKKKAKTYKLRSRLTSAIRKVWLYSPQRRDVLKAAKENGNKCALCNKAQEKLEVDHVKSAVPLSGWTGDWTLYITQMFEGEMMAICKPCHTAKTTVERTLRQKFKKALEE